MRLAVRVQAEMTLAWSAAVEQPLQQPWALLLTLSQARLRLRLWLKTCLYQRPCRPRRHLSSPAAWRTSQARSCWHGSSASHPQLVRQPSCASEAQGARAACWV